jgi:hypothetical protein
MFTGIHYTHIFYALGGSEMPNGQNLRPIAVECLVCDRPQGEKEKAAETRRRPRHDANHACRLMCAGRPGFERGGSG